MPPGPIPPGPTPPAAMADDIGPTGRIQARLRDLGLTPQQAAERQRLAERLQDRLDRVQLTAEEASLKARLGSPQALRKILDGIDPLPRGPKFRQLAEVLECSMSLLIGLDPDVEVPTELLLDDQPSFSLLSPDQDALLRAYGRLDIATRQALLTVALKMAGPEPDPVARRKPRGGARA